MEKVPTTIGDFMRRILNLADYSLHNITSRIDRTYSHYLCIHEERINVRSLLESGAEFPVFGRFTVYPVALRTVQNEALDAECEILPVACVVGHCDGCKKIYYGLWYY